MNTEGYTMFPGCTYIGSIFVTGVSYPVRLHLKGASVLINMTIWKGSSRVKCHNAVGMCLISPPRGPWMNVMPTQPVLLNVG